jgi:hypothetical protein
VGFKSCGVGAGEDIFADDKDCDSWDADVFLCASLIVSPSQTKEYRGGGYDIKNRNRRGEVHK